MRENYRSPLGNTPSGRAHESVVDHLRSVVEGDPTRALERAQATLKKYRWSLGAAFTRAAWQEIKNLVEAGRVALAASNFHEASAAARRAVEILVVDPGGHAAAGERFAEDVRRGRWKP